MIMTVNNGPVSQWHSLFLSHFLPLSLFAVYCLSAPLHCMCVYVALALVLIQFGLSPFTAVTAARFFDSELLGAQQRHYLLYIWTRVGRKRGHVITAIVRRCYIAYAEANCRSRVITTKIL